MKLYKIYSLSNSKERGLGWMRLFGLIITWRDLKKNKLTFSQRYGYKKYIKIGKWVISVEKDN
jgi:hypothetical protein